MDLSGAGAEETALKLSEVVDAIDSPKTERARLTRDVSLLRPVERGPALHLFQAAVSWETGATPRVRSWAGRRGRMTSCAWRPRAPPMSPWRAGGRPRSSPSEASLTRLSVPVPSAVAAAARLAEPRLDSGPGLQLRCPSARRGCSSPCRRARGRCRWMRRARRWTSARPRRASLRCVLTGKGGALSSGSPRSSGCSRSCLDRPGTPRRETLERSSRRSARGPAASTSCSTRSQCPGC